MAHIDKMKKIVIDYAGKLVEDKLTVKGKDTISFRINDKTMLVVNSKKDFANLSVSDIKECNIDSSSADNELALHSRIYSARPETNAILHTHPTYSSAAAKCKVTVPAVLDDMAQIVGPTVKTADDLTERSINKALKGRDACLIYNDGLLSTGRTMVEAFTSCLVVDKACKCYIAANIIGGAKPLSKFDAVVMHIVYKKKYSKKNQANILAEERA